MSNMRTEHSAVAQPRMDLLTPDVMNAPIPMPTTTHGQMRPTMSSAVRHAWTIAAWLTGA